MSHPGSSSDPLESSIPAHTPVVTVCPPGQTTLTPDVTSVNSLRAYSKQNTHQMQSLTQISITTSSSLTLLACGQPKAPPCPKPFSLSLHTASSLTWARGKKPSTCILTLASMNPPLSVTPVKVAAGDKSNEKITCASVQGQRSR